MADEGKTIPVNIMGREFRVACADDERPQLTAAVAYLNEKMEAVKARSKSAGIDRVAIMAALNIAHEYLTMRVAGSGSDIAEIKRRLGDLEGAIDLVMEDQDELF